MDGSSNEISFEEFQKKALLLTKDKVAVEWIKYRSPLKTLGPLGKPVMLLFSADPFFGWLPITLALLSIILSLLSPLMSPFWLTLFFCVTVPLSLGFSCVLRYFPNHKLEHSFIVSKLCQEDKTSFVSLERQRGGILFQFADNVGTLKDYAKGKKRAQNNDDVQVVTSNIGEGFEGMIVDNITSFQLILESEPLFHGIYSLLNNNCQQTVSKFLQLLKEKSINLKFRIPGTDKIIGIGDDLMISHVECLFPG